MLTTKALARADLTNRESFAQTVDVVKRYVRSKMQKYKSVAPALPGGKVSFAPQRERKFGCKLQSFHFGVARGSAVSALKFIKS